MYNPPQFQVSDTGKLVSLIRGNPLGAIVVLGEEGLVANHLPFLVDVEDGKIIRLRAHIPKANPLCGMLQSPKGCLTIFQGADGYVSPSWYATKAEHGKVVPTWNYEVVHVHGKVHLQEDPDWVLEQLQELTKLNEEGREKEWSVSDAPEEFTQGLLRALVGLEVLVDKVEGKTKASQNQPVGNQASILAALEKEVPGSPLQTMMDGVLKK